MKKISNIFLKINRIALAICGCFCAAATLLAAINAILRYTIGAGFVFSDELCVYLIACMVFIALGYLEFTDNHLTIDIFNSVVKNPIIKKIVLYVRGGITMIFYIILIHHGLEMTTKAFTRHIVTNVLRMPRGIIYLIVVVSMILAVASWVVIMICRKGEFEE